VAAAHHGDTLEFAGLQTQPRADGGIEILGSMVERQGKVGQA
jgi:hypothetical protein